MDSTSYSDDFESCSHLYSNDSFEAESSSPIPFKQNSIVSTEVQSPRTWLRTLRRENQDLRSKLRALNDTLNAVIDKKIANRDYKAAHSSRDTLAASELNSASQLLRIAAKEHADLSSRVRQLGDPAYVFQLKTTLQAQEKRLKFLQNARKKGQTLQKVVDKGLERELRRDENEEKHRAMALVTREIEEYEGKNSALEQENERIQEQIAEMNTKVENLEEKCGKLLAIARYQGAFEAQSRSYNKAKHRRKRFEAITVQLHTLSVRFEAEIKALQRQTGELEAEEEKLKREEGNFERKLEEKREKLRKDIAEVRKLRAKVAGTEYAVLLEKIAHSLSTQESAFSSPFWPQQPTLSSISVHSEEQEVPKAQFPALKSDPFPTNYSLQCTKTAFKPTFVSLIPDSNSLAVSPVPDGEPRSTYSLPKPDLFTHATGTNLWISSPAAKSTLFPANDKGEKGTIRPAALSTQSDSLSTFDSFPSRRNKGKVLSSIDSALTASASLPVFAAKTGRDRSHLLQEIETESRKMEDFSLRDLGIFERDRKQPLRCSDVKPAPVLELEESDIML